MVSDFRYYMCLLVATFLAAGGQILFKMGVSGRTALMDYVNLPLAAGLASYGVGTILWLFALSRLPLKVVYPFTALTFVLVYAGAVWILGEKLSMRGVFGIGLVMVGLSMVIFERAA